MKLFFAVELHGSFAEHDDLVNFVTVSLATRVEIYNAPASIAASSLVKSGQWSPDSVPKKNAERSFENRTRDYT